MTALLACGPAVGALAKDGRDNAAPPSPVSVPAPRADDPPSLCEAAVVAAEQRHAVPRGLLGAIAKAESGRPDPAGKLRPWPWSIDADGSDYFFETKDMAVAWARGAPARGVKLLDAGCMQVNLQMHPNAFASLEQAFDPAANADYAARYLRELVAEANGDWNVAVGLYHSHTPYLAADYRDRVAAVGAGIVSGLGPVTMGRRRMLQGTIRLAMAGGGVMILNTSRQPTARGVRRKSRCEIARLLRPVLRAEVKGCSW